MIRSKRLPLDALDVWLVDQRLENNLPNYQLGVWRENRAELAPMQCELIDYVNEAHEDVRRHICQRFEDSLSPFNDPLKYPTANYPSLLYRVTLQSYFGEILSGLAVENWKAHGYMDWVINDYRELTS
jgi:hypothetical protein